MNVTRYSATGNTFVFFDANVELSDEEKSRLVLEHVGDLDGAIFVESRNGLPLMDYFNRDGKRAEFCGNGARAFVWHLVTRKGYPLEEEIEFLTGAGKIKGFVKDGIVFIQSPYPVGEGVFEIDGICIFKVRVGVPHIVVERRDLENVNMETFARPLRWKFDANVNIFRSIGDVTLKMRTYERGVERETLACGSGAVAVAYVYREMIGREKTEFILLPPGGRLSVMIKEGEYYLGGGVEDV